jgi:hypothetical protein
MFPQPIIYDEEVCAACGPTLFTFSRVSSHARGLFLLGERGKVFMGKTFVVRIVEKIQFWNLWNRGARAFILIVKSSCINILLQEQ